MVEQNAQMALSVAHRGVVLQTGYVVLGGTAQELIADDRVRECYLGQAELALAHRAEGQPSKGE